MFSLLAISKPLSVYGTRLDSGLGSALVACVALGAWLTSIGVIAVHALIENDWARLRSFSVTYGLLAGMQLLVLLRFGREAQRGAPAVWLYLLFLLSVAAIGVYGSFQGREAR